MADASHSSNLEAKVHLRKAALAAAVPGWIYVPYCGFGECATGAEYPLHRVVGCDIDVAAVAHWKETAPEATIVSADATKFRHWPPTDITLIDVDAFGNPWKSLHHCLAHGPCADRVEVVATDGADAQRIRGKKPYNFQTHLFEQMNSIGAADQHENFDRYLVEWLAGIGWAAEVRERVKGGQISYWWLTLTRTAPRPKPAAQASEDRTVKRKKRRAHRRRIGNRSRLSVKIIDSICDRVANGATNSDACRLAGIPLSTFYKWHSLGEAPENQDDPAFALHRLLVIEMQDAVADFKQTHVDIIVDHAAENWRASAFLLERRFPEEFARREHRHVSGQNGGPIETKVSIGANLDDMTDSDLERVRQRLRDARQDAHGDTTSEGS